MAFYPESWRKVLDLAKARMRLHIAVQDGFPTLEKALETECQEVLDEVLAHFEKNQWEIERGYYPRYKLAMARLIFNDTHTFRSNIKKSAMKFIRQGYNLSVSLTSTTRKDEDRLALVMATADDLLSTSSYLHGEPDEQGRASNFAHPVLKETVLDFYYSNSGKSLQQFPEFHDAVPYRALLLVAATIHALLSLFRAHGFVDEKAIKLHSQSVQSAYHELAEQMHAVLENNYHGTKLKRMLGEWAQVGMVGYSKQPKAAVGSRKEFAVVLD